MAQSVLSLPFFAIALAAVLSVNSSTGLIRQAMFLLINVAFVVYVLPGWIGVLPVAVIMLLGYGLALASRDRDGRVLALGLVCLVLLFAWMRRYDVLELILPTEILPTGLAVVGLSFIFFKVIHVVVDYRAGSIERLDLLTYTNYCLNFTTFLMGPIQRYQDYQAQWSGRGSVVPLDFESHLDAVIRILLGLVKAYVLAPVLQWHAFQPDTDLTQLSVPGWFLNAYAFWFYLYLNFSGYCDVVIGVGSLLGLRPPENFNRPFLARNISDFWQRQHRSLTLWLTDYVFSPLYKHWLAKPALARRRTLLLCVCLMATMMVSGLWHGTSLSFFLFGVIHGLLFVVYTAWETALVRRYGRSGARDFRARWPVQVLGIALTFNATAFAFVFFRVSSERVVEALGSLVS
jgi:D-alanyl-lipoteichoic acid acyltransferase DltB (MBOAT superfamily)